MGPLSLALAIAGIVLGAVAIFVPDVRLAGAACICLGAAMVIPAL